MPNGDHDPLGILTKKPASTNGNGVGNDPLGILKKKQSGNGSNEDLNGGSTTSALSTSQSQGSKFITQPSKVFDIAGNIQPTAFDQLDEIEKAEFNSQNGYFQPQEIKNELAKSIIAKRNDPVVKYNRAKQFLSQDIDRNKPSATKPVFSATANIEAPDYQKMKPDIIDDGQFNVDGEIPSVQYVKQRAAQLDAQIEDLQSQQVKPVTGAAFGATTAIRSGNYDELQRRIDELSSYKQKLIEYADPIAKVQVYKNTKAAAKTNPYMDMGIKVREIYSPIEAENKAKDIQNGTDALKHKERLAIENYSYEAEGLNTALDAATILKANGQITDEDYNAEVGKIMQSQSALEVKYPEVRFKNIKNALGQIIDRNREAEEITGGQGGALKSVWRNIVTGAPTDDELNEAIKELNDKGANITADEAKKLINAPDVGNTALIGRAFGGVANLANKLASFKVPFTDLSLQSETTRENVQYVINQDLGNTPSKADFQPETIVSTEGTAATNQEFLKPVENPEAGLHNWGWGTLNTVADGIGMVAKLAVLSKGVGKVADVAVGRAVGTEVLGYGVTNAGRIAARTGLSQAQQHTIGTIGGTYLDMYHGFYDAAKQTIGEEQGGEKARQLYANSMAVFNGLAWAGIVQPAQIIKNILGQPATKELAAKSFAEMVSKEGLQGIKPNTLANFYKNLVVETGKAQVKMESIAAVTQAADFAAQAMFNPQTVEDRNLGQELLDGAIHGLSFLPITLLEGRGLARNANQINNVHKDAIFRVATDPASFKAFADREVIEGKTSPLERDRKVQLVNTAAEILKEIPEEFSKEDKLEYGTNLLLIKKLNAQKEKITATPEIKRVEEKIGELEKANEVIYNKTFGEERPVTEEPPTPAATIAEEQVTEPSAPILETSPTEISKPIELSPIDTSKKEEVTPTDVVSSKGEVPLKTIEENINLGDKIFGKIGGENIEGKVTNVGVHKGQIVVDIVDQNGNERFLYSRNIDRIEPKQEAISNITPEQNKRYSELLNKDELTEGELKELGELGEIKRGEKSNERKQLPTSSSKGEEATPSTVVENKKNVETGNALMKGVVTDYIVATASDGSMSEVQLPEKGYLIDEVSLKEGSKKGAGSGQEIYKKALDQHGVLYSRLPVSEDASRVHSKLEQKGFAKIENVTLADGIEVRKITKTDAEAEISAYKYQDENVEPLISKEGDHKGFKFKWVNQDWRFKFENAGDILRELAKYKNSFLDPSYIYEKVNEIEAFIKKNPNYDLATSLDKPIIKRLKLEYEKQPTYSEAQDQAKNLILNLLDGKLNEAKKQIEYFNRFREGNTKENLLKANQYRQAELTDTNTKGVEGEKVNPTEPAAVEKTITEKGKELADKIRSLKTKRDTLQTNIFGIPIAIYDGALESIALAVEGGAKLADAVKTVIKDIRDTHVGFQESEFVKHIEDFAAGEKPRIKVQVGEGAPPKELTAGAEKGEPETISITHARLNEVAEEVGLPMYEKKPEKLTEWHEEADRRIANGEIPDLLSKLEGGTDIPTAPEQLMLLKYMSGLKADYNTTKSDAVFKEFLKVKELSDVVAGRLWGQSGRARQEQIEVHPLKGGLLSALAAKAKASGVETLTDQQKTVVEEQVKLYEERTKAAENKVAALEAKMAEIEAKKHIAKESASQSKNKAVKKTAQDYQAERKTLREKLKQQVEEYIASSKNMGIVADGGVEGFKITTKIAKTIGEIVKSHVEEIGNNLAEVTQRTLDEIRDVLPQVQKKDIHDIIAGVYSERKPPLSELQRNLKDLKHEGKLLKQLSDVESGVPKTEKQEQQKNQRVAELKQQLKDLKKEVGYDDKTKLKALIKSNETETKKINERIAKKDFAPEKPVSIFDNKELQNKFPKEYKELLDAIKIREDARHDFDISVLKDQQSKRKGLEKATDFLSKASGTAKAIVTGVDDSAVAIQTYMASLVRPRVGAKALLLHAEHAFSQKEFDRWLTKLHNSEDYPLMQKSGLNVTEPSSLKEIEKEEVFNNRFSGTVKINGKEYKLIDALLKPFERAFTTLGNATRVLAFRNIAKKYIDEGNTFENNPELFKSLAQRLNTETGRGKENEYIAQASKIVTLGIWSPKLMASKFNILGISDLGSLVLSKAGTKGYYRQLHPRERVQAIKDVAQFTATVAALSYLAAYAFGGDVDDDPLSPTFMDVRLRSGKSFNLTGGFSGYVRTIYEFARGKKTDVRTGETKDVGSLEIAGRFFRGKMPPLTAAIVNAKEGTNFMGQPTTVLDESVNTILPISAKGIYEQIQRDGAGALITGLPTFLGFNVKDKKDFLAVTSPYSEEEINSIPIFKEMFDKGMQLPRIKFDAIEIKDPKAKKINKLADYDDETQDRFSALKKKYLQEELKKSKARGARINSYGEVSPFGTHKNLSKLTPEQLQKVVSSAGSEATKRAKTAIIKFIRTNNKKPE